MEPAHYKTITVNIFQYHYYCRTSVDGNPTLLFLHGFPSTSEHWAHQVGHFCNKGYGVIAPDMLGYGGTSKPKGPEAYAAPDIAAHMISILDAERIDKVIVVSHDWGSHVASRLANLYPARHLATVFLATSYTPPNPELSVQGVIDAVKKTFGRDIVSYWKFFGSEEAPKLLTTHEDSFYSILFTSEPELWKTHVSPEGALQQWLLRNKMAPIASWAPDRKRFCDIFRAGGWIGPTNWYRTLTEGIANEADKDVAKDCYKVSHPVLQVAALRDPICLPSVTKASAITWCTNVTVREVDTSHWVMLERPDELNALIDEFLEDLKN